MLYVIFPYICIGARIKIMDTKQKSRFDTRLPKHQKELFERAAQLGGYNSLSDFIINSAQKQAEKIFQEHEEVLASQKDREIFFQALMNPGNPNKKLHKASLAYKKQLKS